MRLFKWVEWNLQKVAAHALSAAEVEAAFDKVVEIRERRDGSFVMEAVTPAGLVITVIWRYDRDPDEIPDVFGDLPEDMIFVITAY